MGQGCKGQIFPPLPSSVKRTLRSGDLDVELSIHLLIARRLFRNITCYKKSIMMMTGESGVQTEPHMLLSMRDVKRPQQTSTPDRSLH